MAFNRHYRLDAIICLMNFMWFLQEISDHENDESGHKWVSKGRQKSAYPTINKLSKESLLIRVKTLKGIK